MERKGWCHLEGGLCPWEAPLCLSLQWDLVCEQKGLNRATSTFFFVGVLVGAVAFGYLSDRWGESVRKGGGEPSTTSWDLSLLYLCLGTSPLQGADPASPLCRFGRRRLLLVAYVSALVMGLVSAASVSYIMFVITRTLTGTALAGFTIIVMPLGEADKGKAGP